LGIQAKFYRSPEDAVRENPADVKFRAGRKPGGKAEPLAHVAAERLHSLLVYSHG
jgi:hypothetical protein